MRKQRGQANGLVVTLIVVAIVLIIMAISLKHCGDDKHSRRHGKHTTVTGEFLKPSPDGRGRYAYQDDGNWYIYYWIMTDNSRYGDGYRTPALPDGGSWVKVDEEPDAEEVVQSNVQEQVAETEAGVPETESEFTANETDIENQSVEPENTTEPSSEPSTPSDSSPSDSGGDSGGDGGGDGGGSSD
jgi:cell division protein FtsN